VNTFISTFPFVGIFVAIIVLVYWVHSFFIIYHLTRFGIGIKPKLIAMIFFIGSMLLFMAVIYFYNRVDLSAISANGLFKFNPGENKFNFPLPSFFNQP
jgi:CBS domain containing-hemolysin-like protein